MIFTKIHREIWEHIVPLIKHDIPVFLAPETLIDIILDRNPFPYRLISTQPLSDIEGVVYFESSPPSPILDIEKVLVDLTNKTIENKDVLDDFIKYPVISLPVEKLSQSPQQIFHAIVFSNENHLELSTDIFLNFIARNLASKIIMNKNQLTYEIFNCLETENTSDIFKDLDNLRIFKYLIPEFAGLTYNQLDFLIDPNLKLASLLHQLNQQQYNNFCTRISFNKFILEKLTKYLDFPLDMDIRQLRNFVINVTPYFLNYVLKLRRGIIIGSNLKPCEKVELLDKIEHLKYLLVKDGYY